MADYNGILDTQLDPDAPITSELGYQLRDNPIAIAEGSSGAPLVEVAWHFLAGYADATNTNADIDFGGIDISGYRALKIIGGFNCGTSASANFEVQLNYPSGGWTTIYSVACPVDGFNGGGLMASIEILNIDTGDTSQAGHKQFEVSVASAAGSASWPTLIGGDITIGRNTTNQVPTGIRINPGSNNYTGSYAATRFSLYGIKRTQP